MSVRAFSNAFCSRCDEVTLHRYERCVHHEPITRPTVEPSPEVIAREERLRAQARERKRRNRMNVHGHGRPRALGLTPREEAVMVLIEKGMSQTTVAKLLNVTKGTVNGAVRRAKTRPHYDGAGL